MRPLAIDLYCGLGGWTEGLLAEGYNVVGFDIERHQYGGHRYPAQLVVQDALTLHGSQFRDAALIVASPPCQVYSYMAMPWKLAKAKAAEIRADTSGQMLADLNRLFDACFRIQAQASLAAGRHVPMVVENVRGAVPWVGRARWCHGSYALWGDVPALMPIRLRTEAIKCGGGWFGPGNPSWMRNYSSKSKKRRQMTAEIAKIPLPLSTWIARCFKPIASHAPSLAAVTSGSLHARYDSGAMNTFTTRAEEARWQ